MAEIWFISDTHFGHANILTFENDAGELLRPGFESIEAHDTEIVDRWNMVVKPQDHVYHLGDVAMHKEALATVKRCAGHKRLIFGNHDIYDVKYYREVGFEKFFGTRRLDNIIFSHYPIHPRSIGKADLNAHGHTHNNWSPSGSYLNLSVEMINYTPVPLYRLRELMTQQQRTLNETDTLSDHSRPLVPDPSLCPNRDILSD